MGDSMQTIKDLKLVLDEKIAQSENVFITGHNVVNNNLDFDAIGAIIGMYLIASKLNKNVYLLIENEQKLESGVKLILDEMRNNLNIINKEKFNLLKSDNDTLIVLDTNKVNLINCSDKLDEFKNIFVIDHHKEDEYTINTDLKYINENISSASEIITELLLLYKVKITPEIANYLLAGIYLDTNKYTKNCSSKTMRIVSKLLDKGGDIKKVNEFFEEDFLSDRKVQSLVSMANFFTYNIALCISDESVRYTKEELAKVADYLLRYKVDAAIAAGFIDDELISISARSKGKIDVSLIMKEFNGGGNIFSAASKIEDNDINVVSEKLKKILKPSFYIEEGI